MDALCDSELEIGEKSIDGVFILNYENVIMHYISKANYIFYHFVTILPLVRML